MFVREGLCAGVHANMLQFISNINILFIGVQVLI